MKQKLKTVKWLLPQWGFSSLFLKQTPPSHLALMPDVALMLEKTQLPLNAEKQKQTLSCFFF